VAWCCGGAPVRDGDVVWAAGGYGSEQKN
jgi:hypothetical protein